MGTKANLGLLAAALVGTGAAIAWRRADATWATTADNIPSGERLLPIGETRRIVTDDGGELAATIAGPADGDVVVLAHGFTNAREVWAPVAHGLIRAGKRVVLYDQRGHGSSTVGRDGYTIERLGADLRAVLESVDATGAVLVGHSMGGMTIQSLAFTDPIALHERAAALVLVSTAAGGIGGRNRRVEQSFQRFIGGKALARALGTKAGHAFFRNTVGKTVRKADLVMGQQLFLATSGEARSGLLGAMQTMDLRKGIAGIEVPTTVLVGTRDMLTPPKMADELARTIPGARLVRLEGFGHMLPLEAPEQVVDAIVTAARVPSTIGRSSGSLA